MTVYVQKSTTIYCDGYSCIVRPNRDAPEDFVDIVYLEYDKELKYVEIGLDAIPALIEALKLSYDTQNKQA